MKGRYALHGHTQHKAFNRRIKKPKFNGNKYKFCLKCGIKIRLGNVLYCGAARKKTGCSYLNLLDQYKQRNKKKFSSMSAEEKKEFYKTRWGKIKKNPNRWELRFPEKVKESRRQSNIQYRLKHETH